MRRIVILLALCGLLAAPAAAGKKPVKVKVGDDFFSPSTLSVFSGKKVKWVWVGESVHDVAVQSGPAKFKSELQTDGTYAKVLRKKGTYQLLCTVHAPDMTMTISVR